MPISVVLVRPEISQNVGFIARTLKCYDIEKFFIVGRPKYRPNSLAYKTGFTATSILQNAVHTKTLEEALADSDIALGFTRRNRQKTSEYTWNLMDTIPSIDFSLNVALVFGPEAQGLSKEDCSIMTRLVKIDLPHPEMSLNISHAVVVVLHEIFYHGILTNNPLVARKAPPPPRLKKNPEKPARFGDRQDSFEFLVDLLKKKNFFTGKNEAKIKHMRNLWQRANPDVKELEFIMGILKKLGA